MKIIGLVFAVFTLATAAYSQQPDAQACIAEIKQQVVAGSPWTMVWKSPMPARGSAARTNPEGTIEFVFAIEQGEFKGATQNVTGAATTMGPISSLRIENCRIVGRTASRIDLDFVLKDGQLSGTGVVPTTGSRVSYESRPGK